MVDITQLQIAAEEAEISSEMARTRLRSAKLVLAEREERFSRCRERLRSREQRASDVLASPTTPAARVSGELRRFGRLIA